MNNDIIKSHAIMLNVDSSYDSFITKNIIKNHYSNLNIESNILNDIFYKIDNDLFDDVKFIRPDGNFIKKDQLIELMSEYKTYSLYNFTRIYVIEFAENLNLSSANSILKFLEEPEDNIVAILVTKNINNVLGTIVSRCQIIDCNKIKKYNIDNDILLSSIDYLFFYEKYGYKSIAFLSDLYLLKSDELKKIFDAWLFIYDKYIDYKNNLVLDNIYDEKLIELFNVINYDNLTSNVNIIEKMKLMINYNINVRIILDILFIGGDFNEI